MFMLNLYNATQEPSSSDFVFSPAGHPGLRNGRIFWWRKTDSLETKDRNFRLIILTERLWRSCLRATVCLWLWEFPVSTESPLYTISIHVCTHIYTYIPGCTHMCVHIHTCIHTVLCMQYWCESPFINFICLENWLHLPLQEDVLEV